MSAYQKQSITILATIGTTPAVLTEAVYTLVKIDKVRVQAIHYITTTEGQEKINIQLLNPKTGKLKLLFEDLDIPFNEYPTVEKYIPELNGIPLADIRNRREDEVFASTLISVLKKLTTEDQPPVIGLLSGGRKTMSAHMHSAFQLLGRHQDKMIHVLVSPEYEKPGFYYPTNDYKNQDSIIDIVESPYVQLRNLIKPPLNYDLPFNKLVKSAAERLAGSQSRIQSLTFIVKKKRVYINDNPNPIEITARPYSILLFFAFMNKKYGDIQNLSIVDIQQNDEYVHIFEEIYKFITNKKYHY